MIQTSSPRSLFVGGLIMLCVGSILLAVAGFLTWRISGFIERSQVAQGTVTALDPVTSNRSDSDSGAKVTYAPVFTFVTGNGKTVSVTSHSSSNPPEFALAEPVTVLYTPSDPEDARIDTVWQLWGVPLLVGGIGLFLFVVAGIFTLTLRFLKRQMTPATAPQ